MTEDTPDGALAEADSWLETYLNDEMLAYVFPEADSFVMVEGDYPSADVFQAGELVGYVFETHDVVQGLGYSRRPFHLLVGVRPDGVLSGVRLLAHVEPIAILGRTDDDFHQYLTQYGGIDIRKGISMVLGLSDSVLEGEQIAMRETAGDTSDLTPVDAISRITTSSLLFMDSIMRGARKLVRDRGTLLAADDLGRVLDLERRSPQDWDSLLADGSIAGLQLNVGDVAAAFAAIEGTDAPRAIRLSPDENPWTEMYAAFVSPAGIGVNVLGRRWYDQYVAAGRSVGDLVIWVGFGGPGGFRDTSATAIAPSAYETLRIVQDGRVIELSPDLFKQLPFHHIDGAPTFDDQGLFYFVPGQGPDPSRPWTLELFIPGAAPRDALEGTEPASATFSFDYQLPPLYVRDEPLAAVSDVALVGTGFDWRQGWRDQSDRVVLALVGILAAVLVLVFQNRIVRNRQLHMILRNGLLLWTLVWLGWLAGGQVTVIHLMNLAQAPVHGGDLAVFLAEPVVVVVAVASIVTLPIWGRALFCGWLCPFGALQELLGRLARAFRVRQIRIPDRWGRPANAIKYAILVVLLVLTFVDFDRAVRVSSIEPFKTAITFRFNAPAAAMMWAGALILAALFVERFYCRFLCPLGAGFAVLGRIRMFSFLRRRKECGSPCQACRPTCPTGAILQSGKIDMNECFYCLDCQVMHDDKTRCPPLVSMLKQQPRSANA